MKENELCKTIIESMNNKSLAKPAKGQFGELMNLYFSKIYEVFEHYNIEANLDFVQGNDESYGKGNEAWDGLENLMMLIILLEEKMDVNIEIKTKFQNSEEFVQIKKFLKEQLGII